MTEMRRRHVVAGTLGLLVATPASLRAQPAKKPQVAGLALGSPSPKPFWETFTEAMRDLGYVDGQNVALGLHSAEGKADALAALAQKLARDGADVIVAFQTPAATAAKRATGSVPVVMAGVGDPLATGLVASLARPGGNVTGTSGLAGVGASAKNMEILRELLPTAQRIAVLGNATDPFTRPFLQQLEQAAPSARFELRPWLVRPTDEHDATFAEMAAAKAAAVIVQPSLLQPAIYELLMKYRLPAAAGVRQFAEAGGLLSYGARQRDIYRNTAYFVDRILKGARPGELPVQQPTTFDLVINLRTARALGLSVPPALLARADDVIE